MHTTDTRYTFTGLTLGLHDLIIQALGANNTPVAGTRSQARFIVVPGSPNGTQSAAQNPNTQGQQQGNQPVAPKGVAMLPDARSSLPPLSVIGFGILVGGVISALRTRPTANR